MNTLRHPYCEDVPALSLMHAFAKFMSNTSIMTHLVQFCKRPTSHAIIIMLQNATKTDETFRLEVSKQASYLINIIKNELY